MYVDRDWFSLLGKLVGRDIYL